MEKLLLWDLDGTLFSFESFSHDVWDSALSTFLERPISTAEFSFWGKTEPQIMEELLQSQGFNADELPSKVRLACRVLVKEWASREPVMRQQKKLMPGVVKVLDELSNHAVINTVLTGGMAANAVLKLGIAGLTSFFDLEVGAYGSDKSKRTELVDVAIGRVEKRLGEDFSGTKEDVWIIGDTPLDYETAQVNGVNCLLVATGKFAVEELQALGAANVVSDLTDTEAITKLLLT